MKFGTGIDLDNILDKFEGQGHRSKVKVIQIKGVFFEVFAWVFCVINGMIHVHTVLSLLRAHPLIRAPPMV